MELESFSDEEIRNIIYPSKSKNDFMVKFLMPTTSINSFYSHENTASYYGLLTERVLNKSMFLDKVKEHFSQKFNVPNIYEDNTYSSNCDIVFNLIPIIPMLPEMFNFKNEEINELNNKLSLAFSGFIVKTRRTGEQKYISVKLSIHRLLEAVYLINKVFNITPFPNDKLKYINHTIRNQNDDETTHLKKLIMAEKYCYEKINAHNKAKKTHDKNIDLFYDESFVQDFFKEMNNDIAYKELKALAFLGQTTKPG